MLPFFFINISETSAAQIPASFTISSFFNLGSNSSEEIKQLKKMALKIIWKDTYLNMDPKPPFPPAKDMLVLTKVSVFGQGLQLPGRISWCPLKNLQGKFWTWIMPSCLLNSFTRNSWVKSFCFSNWNQVEEEGHDSKKTAIVVLTQWSDYNRRGGARSRKYISDARWRYGLIWFRKHRFFSPTPGKLPSL